MKEKALQVINHYGVLAQLKYFQSEVFELNESIINYELESNLKELLDIKIVDSNVLKKSHIEEEIADVMFMLKQFQEYYGIRDDKIGEIIHYKADRQLKRIENEV